MATILSLAEANKLTIPALLRGVLETFRKRGLPDFFAMMLFKEFQGSTYDFNYEATIAGGASVVDPYSTSDLVEGVGTRTRLSIATKSLARNVDTSKIDMLGKSNVNNIHAQNIRDAAKKMAFDFADEMIRGMGYNNHVNGLDYWVDYWHSVGYTDQDFNAGGATFSSSLLYDMLSRTKMESFDVIFADRKTTVEFQSLLAELPGNVPSHIMDERFGRPMLNFFGIPWIVLDTIAEDKVATSAVVGGTGTTITPAAGDNGFVGFSRADIGRTVTDGTNSDTIASVNFSTGVATLTTGGEIADATKNITVQGPATTGTADERVIYAVRFDEGDGFTAVYHSNPDGPNPDNGEYLTSLAGWSARELGELQGPNIRRARMDWFGNGVVHSPYSVVRMRNFVFPT